MITSGSMCYGFGNFLAIGELGLVDLVCFLGQGISGSVLQWTVSETRKPTKAS